MGGDSCGRCARGGPRGRGLARSGGIGCGRAAADTIGSGAERIAGLGGVLVHGRTVRRAAALFAGWLRLPRTLGLPGHRRKTRAVADGYRLAAERDSLHRRSGPGLHDVPALHRRPEPARAAALAGDGRRRALGKGIRVGLSAVGQLHHGAQREVRQTRGVLRRSGTKLLRHPGQWRRRGRRTARPLVVRCTARRDFDAFADEAETPGYGPIDAPKGIPDVRCVQYLSAGPQWPRYSCRLLYGRYQAFLRGRTIESTHQRTAAQYALLVSTA
ncbi:DUF7373 family lipoprotein [Nocardia cyriacigeorgica]|uniref:DUF7373 family lipoprotein n=1 Tax=Nocardia cyriacigeorgica TaxID=135487 RepID=UPI003CC7DF79